MKKELIVPIFLKAHAALGGLSDETVYMDGDAVKLAQYYSNNGADAILLFDLSEGDAQHDASIGTIKEIANVVDIPIYGGGNIRRMEDVKKLIYAGCRKVFLNYGKKENIVLTQEVSDRFGKDKMMACVRDEVELNAAFENASYLNGVVVIEDVLANKYMTDGNQLLNCYVMPEHGTELTDAGLLAKEKIEGAASMEYMNPEFDLMERKYKLQADGIDVNTYASELSWSELKLNSDGMLPVVVQDYKTQEVLMVAYMNQEAFETTVRTGKMTYWSRSRNELWMKGLTSGHFQYVKELCIDCDNDTLLAKVMQVGAACHTGNRSCFYRTIMKKEYDETNPLKVFEDVFAVILDRKIHPKEGSYTNYLFDKGIDKILKKVGEEATEIVIAAKNPDSEEIKYEISDFLYHVMVLMAERGVTWSDITKELARR